MTRKVHIIFVVSMVLVSVRLFDARFIDKSVLNKGVFVFLVAAFLISSMYFFRKWRGFVLPVQMIVCSTLFSMYMANISWGQSLKHSLYETVPYLTWIFFFYLLYAKPSAETIEKIVVGFGLLYVILYLFQLYESPTIYFGKSLWGDEFKEDRGIARIIFPAGGIFILSVFMAVNKLTSKAKYKGIWLFLVAAGLVIPILQVTRQFIFGVYFFILVHLIRRRSIGMKVAIMVVFVFAAYIVVNSDSKVIDGLRMAIKNDLDEGDDYVRVLAGDYYLSDFSPGTINKIWGNGAPYYGISNYGKFVENVESNYGYYISDVGIVGMYAMFGLIPVIAYILIWAKSFTVRLPETHRYLKYYLWYLLLTSFTWYTVFHYHYLISTVLALYLYQLKAFNSEEMQLTESGFLRHTSSKQIFN